MTLYLGTHHQNPEIRWVTRSAEARSDRETKLKLYSIYGVSEYWISKQVSIYRRENARLVLVATLLENDFITSPLLPKFSCLVSKLFV